LKADKILFLMFLKFFEFSKNRFFFDVWEDGALADLFFLSGIIFSGKSNFSVETQSVDFWNKKKLLL